MEKKDRMLVYFLVIVTLILITIIGIFAFETIAQKKENEKMTIESNPVGVTTVEIPLNPDPVAGLTADFNIKENIKEGYHATDREYELSGKWYKKEIDGVVCDNTVTQGSMVYFAISGTDSFDVYFKDITMMGTPYYAYIIDDAEPVRQLISESHVDLPDKELHIVTLVMDGMSELEFKWSGEAGFALAGIDCHDGEMCGVLPDKKRILFIGDSITEGIMSLGKESNCEHNSASHSCTWYTAQYLDAEPFFLGYGGSGITKVGSFNVVSEMLDYYSETKPVPDDQFPQCDLIVLHVGTNDHDVDDDVFYDGYCEALEKLHTRYPDISIVCVVPYLQYHAEQVKKATEQYDFAYCVDTKEWMISYSDGVHPDVQGAQLVGKMMSNYINLNIEY